MSDVLIYWRDYKLNQVYQWLDDRKWYWHSNASIIGDLQTGDAAWFVASGKSVRREPKSAAFLVAKWRIREVKRNLGEDPAYPRDEYKYRLLADPSASCTYHKKPVEVDGIVRPATADKDISIGRYLQGPRRLNRVTVQQLVDATSCKSL